jgi:glycerate 2-kinase
MNRNEAVTEIFNAALKAVDPYECVKAHAGSIVSAYGAGKFDRMLVVGFGKAAYLMTKALSDYVGDVITTGLVITKYGHTGSSSLPERVLVREAGHPVPDENGYLATMEAIKLISGCDTRTFIVCLISGGGSALLVAPYGDITLSEKQSATRLLLKGGADISEINTVRKHISSVKGGRLAELAHPSRVVSLILSDVVGDRLDVIASGPTVPDSSTYVDAFKVITKYGMVREMPRFILNVLEGGVKGRVPETPKAGSPVFEKVDNIIVGNNRMAVEAAREMAESLGFAATVVSSTIVGEARSVAHELAGLAKASRGSTNFGDRKGLCLISGGEPTVTVTGKGLGGRNMELALAYAMEIEGFGDITFLSAGTDGTDGPTDAAGAVIDGTTTARARAEGLDPFEYLTNNDAYNFFKNAGGLFVTGPTGTNVMDLHVALIRNPTGD